MLAEYLEHAPAMYAEWTGVAPGTNVCRFALPDGKYPVAIPAALRPMHFEALFCTGGTLAITRRNEPELSAGSRDILLLSDTSHIRTADIVSPLSGMLVVIDARSAHGCLEALAEIFGGKKLDTSQVKRRMDACRGCAVLRSSAWSGAVFETLETLPQSEQGRYCVLKSAELLYLLCAQSVTGRAPEPALDRTVTRAVMHAKDYMEAHLDEKLTIERLSRMSYLSPTMFKACFRRIYGQPVHTWLRGRRMERAAELLRTSSRSVLEISQAVGYGSASQFSAAFGRHFGSSPGQYRKLSELGGL